MRTWLPAISTLALLGPSLAAAQESAPAENAADAVVHTALDLVSSALVPCAGGGIACVLRTAIHYARVPVGVALAGPAWQRDAGSVVGAIANVLPTVFAVMIATATTSRYLASPNWLVFDWSTAPIAVSPISLALFVLTRHLANGSLALVLDGVTEPEQTTPLPDEQ